MSKISIEKNDLDQVGEAELSQIASVMHEDAIEGRYPIPQDPPDILIRRVMKRDMPDRKIIRFIAKDGDTIVGISDLWINTGKSDRGLISVSAYITPEYRRNGIAKLMLKSMINHFPDIITKVSIGLRRNKAEERNNIEDLLDTIGAKKVYLDRQSASLINEFNKEEVIEIAEIKKLEAIEKGFEIVEVEDVKFENSFDLPAYIKALETIWNDMPRDEGTWDDEILDEEKYQAFYKDIEEFGDSVWTFIAIHIESGKIAGMTETWVKKSLPTVAIQDDTGVISEFRGNALGLTLKYQMLAKLLSDPRSKNAKYWPTGNADSNSHMLKINDILKYRPVYYYAIYEMPRVDFERYLGL
jgi:GNAT superfamily N-acetyltransferase